MLQVNGMLQYPEHSHLKHNIQIIKRNARELKCLLSEVRS